MWLFFQIFQFLLKEDFRLIEFKPSLCDVSPSVSTMHFGELTFLKQPRNLVSEKCGDIGGTNTIKSNPSYEWWKIHDTDIYKVVLWPSFSLPILFLVWQAGLVCNHHSFLYRAQSQHFHIASQWCIKSISPLGSVWDISKWFLAKVFLVSVWSYVDWYIAIFPIYTHHIRHYMLSNVCAGVNPPYHHIMIFLSLCIHTHLCIACALHSRQFPKQNIWHKQASISPDFYLTD